jgi:HSP20 family protein
MEKIVKIRWQRLQDELGTIAYSLTKMEFAQFARQKRWRPALNAYRCADRFVICVELAGVERSAVKVRAERRRLIIQGTRPPPDPPHREHKPVQVLAMEIDFGHFECELVLPVEVEHEKITVEQANGLLWLYLPMRSPG